MSNTKTIDTKFDVTALPKWAQKNTQIVELCKRDLGFRVNVHNAKTAALRNVVKRAASRYSNR